MKLYLARHGDYLPGSIQHEEGLSETGNRLTKNIVYKMKDLSLNVSAIYHSGKKRAEETAIIFSDAFISPKPPLARAGLAPMDDITPLVDDLSFHDQDVLIVGHLPFLSKLVSKLVVNDENLEIMIFQPSTIVCLGETHERRWLFHWLISPELIDGVS